MLDMSVVGPSEAIKEDTHPIVFGIDRNVRFRKYLEIVRPIQWSKWVSLLGQTYQEYFRCSLEMKRPDWLVAVDDGLGKKHDRLL